MCSKMYGNKKVIAQLSILKHGINIQLFSDQFYTPKSRITFAIRKKSKESSGHSPSLLFLSLPSVAWDPVISHMTLIARGGSRHFIYGAHWLASVLHKYPPQWEGGGGVALDLPVVAVSLANPFTHYYCATFLYRVPSSPYALPAQPFQQQLAGKGGLVTSALRGKL